MALTDAQRLQMTAMALMRHSVLKQTINTGEVGLISDPVYTTDFTTSSAYNSFETLTPNDFVGVSYSYVIT